MRTPSRFDCILCCLGVVLIVWLYLLCIASGGIQGSLFFPIYITLATPALTGLFFLVKNACKSKR